MFDLGDGCPDLDSPSVWAGLIESVGPASLLLIIESRLGRNLRRQLTPEDILQVAFLRAWRDRGQCQWRGLHSFRSWLLTIIDHCIRDAADFEKAQKRGGGDPAVAFSALRTIDGSAGPFEGAAVSTTPSRLAIYKEQAAAMEEALAAVAEPHREVVRLRLLEQLRVHEIAKRLGIGIEAVRHRFRVGSEIYKRRLLASLSTRDRTRFSQSSPDSGCESASNG